MPHIKPCTFAVIGFFSLALTTGLYAEESSTQRLENVQSEIKTLSKELGQSKASKDELFKQLKEQSQSASKLNKELHTLDNAIAEQSATLTKLKKQVEQENKAQAQQLEHFEQQLRAAFSNAKPSYLKILLNQDDPAKLSRSSVYFQYFHLARQQQLKDIDQSLANLSDDQRELYAAHKKQQTLYESRKQQQQQLTAQNKQRQLTLNQLERKIDQQSDRISELKAEEKALQQVFASIAQKAQKKPAKAYKSTTKFSKLKGQLPWPLKGKVSARYGTKRNLGNLTWQGIMIDAPSGKEVRSIASGQVVFSGWLRGFGLLIIVDHGDKYMTLYGNNQTLLKEVGDKIDANELIAQSGDKGIRQYAGLYFEIRYKGSPTNPKSWLSKQS